MAKYTDFVGPDGPLNSVAFESLVNSDGAYLVESYQFHYITSGRELNRIYTRGNPDVEPGNGLLAIGDLDFDFAAAVAWTVAHQATNNQRLLLSFAADLPQSDGEVSWSAKILAGSKGGGIHCPRLGRKLNQLRGPGAIAWRMRRSWHRSEATEENFKQHCSGKRVLYMATHGFTQVQPVTAEHLAKDADDDYIELIAEQSPLLKSGLVFSGANALVHQTLGQYGEDGIATGEEISCLNLDGTDLVVLSACHSGTGDIVNGEGVYSLRRAFEIAGAKTIVSSLWAVDDNMTRDVMMKTVSQNNLTIGAALRTAMLSRIGELREQNLSDHPYYWAGFVCSGDPRTKLFPDDRGGNSK
ncbi:MAG: CHAT domain-containing protein [bacterium]|nr:CHAT domain-containing protein [bacterium]